MHARLNLKYQAVTWIWGLICQNLWQDVDTKSLAKRPTQTLCAKIPLLYFFVFSLQFRILIKYGDLNFIFSSPLRQTAKVCKKKNTNNTLISLMWYNLKIFLKKGFQKIMILDLQYYFFLSHLWQKSKETNTCTFFLNQNLICYKYSISSNMGVPWLLD